GCIRSLCRRETDGSWDCATTPAENASFVDWTSRAPARSKRPRRDLSDAETHQAQMAFRTRGLRHTQVFRATLPRISPERGKSGRRSTRCGPSHCGKTGLAFCKSLRAQNEEARREVCTKRESISATSTPMNFSKTSRI